MSRALFAAILAAVAAESALAQGFPSKPLTLFCPCPPATATDRHVRGFAQIASKYLGQLVMVENRTGPNGMDPKVVKLQRALIERTIGLGTGLRN